MKRAFLAAAAMCLASSALAMTYTDGDLTVKLRDEPCSVIVPILALSTVSTATPKLADVTYKGEPRAACWVEKDGVIFIADELGAGGYLDKGEFK